MTEQLFTPDELPPASARFAKIVGGIVDNIVTAETAPGDIWVQCPDDVSIGWAYDGTNWTAPVVVEDKRISVGAFKDRLGMDALAIAVSGHPVCVALREMLYDRKHVDMSRPDVRGFLDMMIVAGQPEASPVFPGSGPMTAEKKAAILDTPVSDPERP
ncbi:MAG: hypothetical protein ACO3GP_03175 [Candidatus Limnocylindrus sp.]